MLLPLINLNAYSNNKILRNVYILLFVLLLGSATVGRGTTVLSSLGAPLWLKVLFIIGSLPFIILFLWSINNEDAQIGTIELKEDGLKTKRKKKEQSFKYSELNNLLFKPNYKMGILIEGSQSWLVQFEYKGEKYDYDFAIPKTDIEKFKSLVPALSINLEGEKR